MAMSFSKQPRVLLISLEFADPIFSGNGVYSRTIARALLRTGHEVMVLSGRPAELSAEACPAGVDGVSLLTVGCDIWKRLDRYSSWEQFGRDSAQHANRVQHFGPTIVIGVDWTSVLAHQQLQLGGGKVPLVYMNFRIATHSTGVSGDDVAFYKAREAAAMAACSLRVALCEMDGRILQEIYPQETTPAVLSPCLREDIKLLATTSTETAKKKRRFITCCSRITLEKNVHRFVELCVLIKAELKAQGLVPCLVGSRIPGEAYGDTVVAELKGSFPGETSYVSDFMPHEQLCAVYEESVLLVLPSLYDSWGMVVTEAAAFGVPSVLHNQGIGAADLLIPGDDLSIGVSLHDIGEAAERVKQALGDRQGLARMGERARAASLGWDEAAYASKLAAVVLEGISYRGKEEAKGEGPRTGVALADATEGDLRNGGCGMGWC